MRVKEIMKKAVMIDRKASLREAAKLMVKEHIGSLIIMDGAKTAGIVTERDMLKALSNDKQSLEGAVSDIMSTNLITIGAEEFIDDAATVMSKKKIKKLPVENKGKIVGIITSTDIVAHSDDMGDFSVF